MENYDLSENNNNRVIKVLIFIMISAVLIVFTDVFVLDGRKKIWPNGVPEVFTLFQNNNSNLSGNLSIDVASLRDRHQQYMDEGIKNSINFTPPALPPPPVMARNKVESANSTLAQNDFSEPASDEVIDIQPAAGTEGDIKSDVKSNFDEMDDIYGKVFNENLKTVPETKIAKDILYDIPKTEILKPRPKTKMPDVFQYSEPKGAGNVVIIIDDMGLNLRSKIVEILPGPLTLAYLPYAKNLPKSAARASSNGHELMLHMPMEAMNTKLDGGPKVLRSSQSDAKMIETLDWALSQFSGYVGVNNHMGSRFTSDPDAMRTIISHLKSKGLYFIDSKTIGSSVAAEIAREGGIPYAERDIFLDHEVNQSFVRSALKKLEAKARKQGYAIAIGHPHKETIAVLKEWLPTLKEKGLTLVPASAVLKQPITLDAVAQSE